MDETILETIDVIEHSKWVKRKAETEQLLSIEEQAKLSVTAAAKGTRNYVPTPIKNNIEDALDLLSVAISPKPKSFGQEMADLNTSLNFLGKVLDEMKAIQRITEQDEN